MSEENKTTIASSEQYDGLPINGSFEDDSGGTEQAPAQQSDSKINSSASIRAAALEEKGTGGKKSIADDPNYKVKNTDVELDVDELDETIDQQIAKGKIPKAKLVEAAPQGEQVENKTVEQTQETQQTDKPAQPLGRDYTGIEDKDKWAFEKMPNKAFERHKATYLALRQAQSELTKAKTPKEGDLPASYREHPQAYTLSPTYKKLVEQVDFASAVEEHWLKQQISIQTSGKFRPLVKEGDKLKIGPEQDATEDDRLYVNRNVSAMQRQLAEAERKHEQYINDYKTNHQRDIEIVRTAEKELFPDFDKDDHPTAALQKQIVEKFPEMYRDNPLMNFVKYTSAANLLLNAKLIEYEKKLGIRKDKAADVAKAQPTNKSFIPGGASNGRPASRINSSADIRRAALEG